MKRMPFLSAMLLLFAAAAAAVLLMSLSGGRSLLRAEAFPSTDQPEETSGTAPAPSGLSGEALENGELRLTWDGGSVAGASLLELSYRREGEADFTVAVLSADLSGCLLVGFGDGEAVELRLRMADASGGYSSYSDALSLLTVNTQPPASPAGFSGAAYDGAASLSWEENGESDLLGYLLEYRKSGDPVWMSVETDPVGSCTRDGLVNGQSYEFRLMAKDSAGLVSLPTDTLALTPSSASGPAGTKPGASSSGAGVTVRTDTPATASQSGGGKNTGSPGTSDSSASGGAADTLSGLRITAGKDSDILAVWDVAGDSAVTEVELSYQREGVSSWSSRSAAYSAGQVRLTALSAGSVYSVRVRARTASGWGSYSTPAALTAADTTPPSAPAGLSASAGDKAAILGWTPNAEADLAGYRLEYRAAGSSDWLTLSPGKSASELRVTGLVNGTAYEFRLLARDAAGNWSSPSPTVSATPKNSAPPPTPAGLKGQAQGHDSVLLTWNVPAASDGVAGYRLEYAPVGGSPVSESLGAVVSATITGLLPETSYVFSLWAMDAAGRLSDSPKSVTVATPKMTLPAPYDLSVSATASGTGAVVNWSYPDDVSLSSFIIEYRLMGTSKGQITAGPLSRSCTVDGLPPDGGYQFYVTAVDLKGNLSEKAGPVTLALVDETAPQAPSGLTASASGTGAEVSWSASPDGDVAGYELRYGTSGSNSTVTLGGGVTYTGISDLVPGATYSFSVRAFDKAGNHSSWSASASCTIRSAAPPDAPMGVTADGGEGSLTISWWPNSERNIEGYEVNWSGPQSGSTFTSGTSLSLSSLPAGSYTVSVRAKSSEGVYSSGSSAAAEVTEKAPEQESGGGIDSGAPDGIE